MNQVLCEYDPPHTHSFPADWQFAGPRGTDCRADPRWKPTTYVYLDASLHEVWSTQVPRCVDEALDKFSLHRAYAPAYLQFTDEHGQLQLAPFQYDYKTDTVFPLEA